jgi:hypothetical protein
MLPTVEEDELVKMLNAELDGRANRDICIRMHQKFVVLRAKRERKQIEEIVASKKG